MPDVSTFNPNPDVSEYSPYGRNYGNGLLNLLAFSSFGFNYAPKPEGAQGMYDAYYQRERSKQFMNIQADAFSNNMLFKMGGFDPENNLLQFAGKAFGSPDGAVARMLSPLIGGNPMAAQMQLYAGLSGASTMGAFGRAGDVTKRETDEMMKVIEKNFYRTTPIEDVEREMDAEFSQKLIDNPELAQQLGFGVPLTEDGKVDEGKVEELKVKGAQRAKDAQELKTMFSDVSINTAQAQRQYNPKLTENVTPKLEGVLKDLGVTQEQMATLRDPAQTPESDQPTPQPTPTPQQNTGQFNLGAVKETIAKAEERLKTPEEYNNQLADRMAEMMDLSPLEKGNVLTRKTTLEGGVPTRIDGKEVPAELHTQEQRDRINAARQIHAANNDLIAPEAYGKGVPAADPSLYADIVPPEQNEEKRKALRQQVQQGYRLVEAMSSNESRRAFDPEQVQTQTQQLENRLKATGLVENGEIDRNKTSSGVISGELVKSVETRSKIAIDKIETLTKNLKENENKVDTPEYDAEVSRAITDKIKESLKKDFNVTDEQLTSAVNNKGMINPEFVQKQVDRQNINVKGALELAKKTEQAAEKKPIDREALTTSAEELSGLVSDLGDNELKSATQGYDRDLSKAISDKIKQKLKDAFETTEDELSGAMDQNGIIDKAFVQQKVAKQTEILQKQEARKQREEELRAQVGEPPDLETIQQKQAEIRKTLKEKYNVSDEMLAKGTDEQGNLKPEFIAEVYSQEMKRADIEQAGLDYNRVKEVKLSKESPKILGHMYDKQMKSNEVTQIQQELEDLGDSETEAAKEKRTKLKAQLKTKLKNLGVSDAEVEANSTFSGGFLGMGQEQEIDPEFIKKKQQEATKITYAEVEASRMQKYKEAGVKYSGINFEKTRGFNIEDFTSAFTAAADLRLLGGKGTPTGKMDDFMKNAGGALSAARSVFGDELSGGQLVGRISDLLGTDTQNLSSQKGSEEIEKTLRDVKSTARVAGSSIEALLGIIETARDVAKNNPKLRYLSASATTDMAMKSMATAAGLATSMSSAEYRNAGGTQNIAAGRLGEKQKLLGGEMGQALVAIQQKLSGDPKKLAAFDEVMKRNGYDQRGLLQSDLPNFYAQLSKATGMGIGELSRSASDPFLQQEGMKNKKFTSKATSTMEKGAMTQFWKNVERKTGMSKEELMVALDEKRKQNPEVTLMQQLSEIGGGDRRITKILEETPMTVMEDAFRSLDKAKGGDSFDKIDKMIEQQTNLDTELDKKLAGRNAPVITQIMSELASGGTVNKDKIEKLTRIFADPEAFKDQGEATRLKEGFTNAFSAANQQNSVGVAEGISEATDVDVSQQDMEDIAAATKGGPSDYKEAFQEYKRLVAKEKNGRRLSETEQTRLRAYNKMKDLGIMGDATLTDEKALEKEEKDAAKRKAFETTVSGEGPGAVAAGAYAAVKNKKDQEAIEATKAEVADIEGQKLMLRAKSATTTGRHEDAAQIQKLMEMYTGEDGKPDMVKMMEDAKEGTGAFDAESEQGKQFKEALGKEDSQISMVRENLKQSQAVIDETENKIKGTGEDTGTQQDLPKMLQDLIKKLDEGKLVSAISDLATAVGKA